MSEIVFALTVMALFLKMFVIAGVQGINRMQSGVMVRPEDAAYFVKQAPAAAELPIVDRAQSTLRNDLENIPIFLFLMLAYMQLNGPPMPLAIYAAVFVLARCGHSYFYLRPRQPHRNRLYLVGIAVDFVLCGHLFWLMV